MIFYKNKKRNMKIGIIQSCYIPWRGYFDFIDDVDLFVFFDDIQFGSKGKWRNRNRIKTANGLIWLTVPIRKNELGRRQIIENVEIDYTENWIKKHIKSLTLSYSKTNYFSQYADNFFNILETKYSSISELNIKTTHWLMEQFNITTETKRASDFQAIGSKTDRLIDIIKKTGANTYVSGPLAKDYIEDEKFKEAGLGLEYKTYEYPDYPQLYGAFENNLSVLDLLFNCGPESRRYLKSMNKNAKVL
jgi:hypothetical protein